METSVNNKCKAFTSLEQSRKLAEILPLETADMYYDDIVDSVTGELFIPDDGSTIKVGKGLGGSIVAWSLAALLGVLPRYELNNFGDTIQLDVNLEALATEGDETLLDLVVNMIIHLHELNLL